VALSPGYVATFNLGGTALDAHLKGVKIAPTRKDLELPVLGGGTINRLVGPVGTTIELNGYIDHTISTVFTNALAQATPTTLSFSYAPQGATGGTRSGVAYVLSYDEDTEAEGAGSFSAKLVVDGTMTMT